MIIAQIKEIENTACPRCGFEEIQNQNIDISTNNVIIIKDKKNRKRNMDVIIENYYQRRFNTMMRQSLKNIGERFPLVNQIMSIVYEEKQLPQNNICPCVDKENHFIRHLYKIVIKNEGVPLYLGERCLVNHGYPLSLCRALEKTRRIIKNDIEKIVKLAPDELVVAVNLCKKTVATIIQNKYMPGIFFLREFGGVINDLFGNSFSLSPWLAYMLGILARHSIENLPKIKLELQQKNRLIYKDQYDFLNKVNSIVCGRCKFIKEMLQCIDNGDSLTHQQENAITMLIKKYDEALLQKTEEAFPFLFALNSGKIVIIEQDALVPSGQTYSLFQSMLKQIEKGSHLTIKQIELLRKKYLAYKQQYLQIPVRERMSTVELMQAYNQADENEIKQEIAEILLLRGITINVTNSPIVS